MPARIKQRILLAFVANLAQLQFFVRNLKLHRALSVPFPLPEPPSVCVPSLCIYHGALPVRLVGSPLPRIGVAVRVGHSAVAGFAICDEVAGVGVARESDVGAVTVGTAALKGDGEVVPAEIGAGEMVAEEGGVVVAAEVLNEFCGAGAFAFGFENNDPVK